MFEEDFEAVNSHLETLVQEVKAPHNSLYQAARYSLLSPGKRIRPLLAIATGQMLGSKLEALLHPACALEMVHAYSLIHDDLPAMDNDDFRRGKPSLHKAFGEAKAILAGDYLLTYTFEVLVKAPHLSSEQRLQLIQTLSEASGGDGMVGGQVMDMEKASHDIVEINSKKTGALITASVQFGGIVAGASATTMLTLTQLGQTIGLLFQACDDILDGEVQDLIKAKKEAQKLYSCALSFLEKVPGERKKMLSLLEKIFTQISKT